MSKTKSEFKETGSVNLDTAKNEAMDKAKEVGNQMKDTGNQMMGKARDAVGSVSEMAGNAACAVGKKTEELASAAGHQVHEAANVLRQRGPHDGMAGRASEAVADALEGGAHYLEDMKLSNVARDVTDVVRSHPIPAILICLGVGFCIGRSMRD